MPELTKRRGVDISARKIFKYLDGEYLPDGFRRASVIYSVAAANLVATLPAVGTEAHPLLGNNWRAYTYRWRHHEKISKSLVFLQVDYVSAETAVQEDEADSIACEEAITSHPNFLAVTDGIAGDFPNLRTVDPATGRFEGTPRPGAKFQQAGQNKFPAAADYREDVGTFLAFLPGATIESEGTPYPLAGLERYYLPKGTFNRSYSTLSQPSLAGVGSQCSTPPYRAPALSAGFNWLLMRRSYRRLGLIYRCSEVWWAGRWNAVIYPISALADGPQPA